MSQGPPQGPPQRPGVGSDPRRDHSVAEIEVEQRFLQTVDQGRRRLSRRTTALLATGAVGGIDMGMGVLALLLTVRGTGSDLVGGLALSVGFITLTYARSELFTEDFLVPVMTVMSRQARLRSLFRLWGGTFAANLAAGWLVMWFVMRGLHELDSTAIQAGRYYAELGFGVKAFMLALLGGIAITLMTWMEQGAETMGAKAVPATTTGFLLGAGKLNHAVVASLLMFAALQTGHAPFGYVRWAEEAAWAAFGNMVGGVCLVTALRLLQVPHRVREELENPAPGVPIGDQRRATDKE